MEKIKGIQHLGYSIQAVIFKNDRWTTKMARKWLDSHGLQRLKKVHKTETYLRYRITNPNFSRFITVKVDNGVKIIFGI